MKLYLSMLTGMAGGVAIGGIWSLVVPAQGVILVGLLLMLMFVLASGTGGGRK